MLAVITNAPATLLAAATTTKDPSSNFLVSPDVGLMLWTLIAFGVAMFILKRKAFPAIAEALDKRQHAIEESIDHAERVKSEADALLTEYRGRLTEARAQADEIVAKARKAGEDHERESQEAAQAKREELVEQAKKDIEGETRRAIQEIRNEVADLTILATEKVTRKSLTSDDQKRLVEEALGELDFSSLGSERNN